MGIQPAWASTAASFYLNSPRQQHLPAGSSDSTSSKSFADMVTSSQAAYDQAKGGADYNFTNMTPKQMMKVSQELYDSGKINSKQHLMLISTGLTLGHTGKNGQYISPSDAEIARHNNTPMDYIQYSKDRIRYLESTGQTTDPQFGYESWKDILATMQGLT
ncbi:hypothetical protein JWJ90_09515 [Desulfobulbus rhabdoformis]|uniref:hypothetical protein n=1 Tax=Desulfobulbus rhabdoformis TaxID=34032 RepID=UPI0019653AF5|nr:hypothetical protein [Desulfobulbus rhabdoformis]MBM9614527.1 hypothetical protein [Desulfobulbus rhabdoformis]